MADLVQVRPIVFVDQTDRLGTGGLHPAPLSLRRKSAKSDKAKMDLTDLTDRPPCAAGGGGWLAAFINGI